MDTETSSLTRSTSQGSDVMETKITLEVLRSLVCDELEMGHIADARALIPAVRAAKAAFRAAILAAS
jgi:hypothetical protein